MKEGSAVFASISIRGCPPRSRGPRRGPDRGRHPRVELRSPSVSTSFSGSAGSAENPVSSMRAMFRPNAGARRRRREARRRRPGRSAAAPGRRPSPSRGSSSPSPIAGARSSRSRRRATRNDDIASALPARRTPLIRMSGSWRRTSQMRQDEQDDRGEVDGQRSPPTGRRRRAPGSARAPVWVSVANGRTSQARSSPSSEPATSPTTSRKMLSIDSHSASWPVDSPSARSRANSPIRSLVETVELTRKPMPANSIAASDPSPRMPISPSGTGSVDRLARQLRRGRSTLARPGAERSRRRGEDRGLCARMRRSATTRRPAAVRPVATNRTTSTAARSATRNGIGRVERRERARSCRDDPDLDAAGRGSRASAVADGAPGLGEERRPRRWPARPDRRRQPSSGQQPVGRAGRRLPPKIGWALPIETRFGRARRRRERDVPAGRSGVPAPAGCSPSTATAVQPASPVGASVASTARMSAVAEDTTWSVGAIDISIASSGAAPSGAARRRRPRDRATANDEALASRRQRCRSPRPSGTGGRRRRAQDRADAATPAVRAERRAGGARPPVVGSGPSTCADRRRPPVAAFRSGGPASGSPGRAAASAARTSAAADPAVRRRRPTASRSGASPGRARPAARRGPSARCRTERADTGVAAGHRDRPVQRAGGPGRQRASSPPP